LIQLFRPAEPDSLIRNRANWTTRWTDILRDGRRVEWATRTAKVTLRNPLLAFSYGKCAFCECRLNLTSAIEIEHYHSKIVRPELAFHWQNLFPACGLCNRSKGELDHEGRLLKPDEENPEPMLWLHPGTGELEPHPSLGAVEVARVRETIDAYGLNRGILCAERIRIMDDVNRWLKRVADEDAISGECKQEWEKMVDPSFPLKFVVRHVLTLSGQERLAEIDRQTFLERV
jgi:uncharacterized protein (TIGR02646 family)